MQSLVTSHFRLISYFKTGFSSCLIDCFSHRHISDQLFPSQVSENNFVSFWYFSRQQSDLLGSRFETPCPSHARLTLSRQTSDFLISIPRTQIGLMSYSQLSRFIVSRLFGILMCGDKPCLPTTLSLLGTLKPHHARYWLSKQILIRTARYRLGMVQKLTWSPKGRQNKKKQHNPQRETKMNERGGGLSSRDVC